VEEYLKAIGISDEPSQCVILRETLDEKIRNQLIFEEEYNDKIDNLKWNIEK